MVFPFSLAGKRQRSFCSWAFFGLLTQLALAVVAQTEGWAEGEWVQQSFATSPVVSSEDEDVLTGEAALQQLKQDGSYDSLAEAMTAARYGMREVEGLRKEAWAQNPKQWLYSRFDETGLRLVVKAGPEERYPSRWELKSVAGEAVPSGTL